MSRAWMDDLNSFPHPSSSSYLLFQKAAGSLKPSRKPPAKKSCSQFPIQTAHLACLP